MLGDVPNPTQAEHDTCPGLLSDRWGADCGWSFRCSRTGLTSSFANQWSLLACCAAA